MLRTGLISHTGVGGLTLGGGIGFTSRFLGLTCDALVGARVVTSSGTLLVADEHNHADLFWVGPKHCFVFVTFRNLVVSFIRRMIRTH
jgi:FAD/FMN-containing dehydrogenase